MKSTEKLLEGFGIFQKRYFGPGPSLFDTLKREQTPGQLVISCSDSRCDPALLFNAEPGDLFSVRAIAGLVPPFEEAERQAASPSAIAYAVDILQVNEIILLGHSCCGGVAALRAEVLGEQIDPLLSSWLRQAKPLFRKPHIIAALDSCALEQEVLKQSLNFLKEYPSVQGRLRDTTLLLRLWYFDFQEGRLLEYDEESDRFQYVV